MPRDLYEIRVEMKDGKYFEADNVFSVIFVGGNLLIQMFGILGEIASKHIDDSLIISYVVKVQK